MDMRRCPARAAWRRRTTPGARTAFRLVVTAILAAPISVVLAVLLQPLWSWVEATFVVESIGHFGPARWCYLPTYVLTATLGGLLVQRAARGR